MFNFIEFISNRIWLDIIHQLFPYSEILTLKKNFGFFLPIKDTKAKFLYSINEIHVNRFYI